MAFWDFVNEPVGGGSADPYILSGDPAGAMTQPSAWPAQSTPSSPATPTPVGPKPFVWGDFLKTLMGMAGQYQAPQASFSGPGSFGPQQGSVYPIGPTADFSQPKEKENTSIGEVAQIAGMFFGA